MTFFWSCCFWVNVLFSFLNSVLVWIWWKIFYKEISCLTFDPDNLILALSFSHEFLFFVRLCWWALQRRPVALAARLLCFQAESRWLQAEGMLLAVDSQSEAAGVFGQVEPRWQGLGVSVHVPASVCVRALWFPLGQQWNWWGSRPACPANVILKVTQATMAAFLSVSSR